MVRFGALAAVLGLAAWLRLWRLDLVEFKGDQGFTLRAAEDWLRVGHLPLVGLPSSIGIPEPPWFTYLVTPAVALDRDPAVATAEVGLLNVFAVGGVALLGWRWFSPLAGLAAGLVLATNPWAVFFSRVIWPNDVLVPAAQPG